MEFNYLVYDEPGQRVRYGWSGKNGIAGLNKRLSNHARDGYTQIVMLCPGNYENEQANHAMFKSRGWGVPYNQSTYLPVDELFEWATALIMRGYAARTIDAVKHLPELPFHTWRFGSDLSYGDADGQLSLIQGVPVKERPEFASSMAILSSLGDEWFTPDDVLDRARLAMGAFDLDPASCYEANERVRAASFFSKATDGLAHNHRWSGRIWLNPPYGRGERAAGGFIAKLVEEFQAGHVTEAITCLNLNSMSAMWFQPLHDIALSHAIWKGRVNFVPPKDKLAGSPTKGTVLSYVGRSGPERFETAYGDVCSIMRPCVVQRPSYKQDMIIA